MGACLYRNYLYLKYLVHGVYPKKIASTRSSITSINYFAPFLYRFDCKSASYDHLRKECHLSADDRHTNPDSFVPKAGTDYLGMNEALKL